VARVVRDYIIPRPELGGLWHLSSDPISKYDLLKLVAKTYGKNIEYYPMTPLT
jgi:dTDP-4-dehydrorhamnose reductase